MDPETLAPDLTPTVPPHRDLPWVFLGPQGLRAGWSILLFAGIGAAFLVVVSLTINSLLHLAHIHTGQGPAPLITIASELILLLSIAAAAVVVARIEGRPPTAYYLAGPRPVRHLVAGLAAGFAALSALVGAMAAGGWLRFGPPALSGPQILLYAALWGTAFLLVGCFEEGLFRGFLQFTLARGVNLWWALGVIALLVVAVALNPKAYGGGGVYAAAALGLLPALWAHIKKLPSAGFWQAAWVTSTAFGFIHTGNNGESWIGIFAAAFIGFVFCVSIRLTGSLWWAIGCHAAWDWAETYFYGTADSGFAAKGHLFTTNPAGNPLWSGGADGPEASLLVLPIILLLLAVLVLLHRRQPGQYPVSD